MRTRIQRLLRSQRCGIAPFTALLSGTLVAACGGGSPADPDIAPRITVTGVADQASYSEPVTITVAVDRGSYQATLDGAAFVSGQVVSAPGAHVLRVMARSGAASSDRSITFTIQGAPGGALIIRMLDLGANGAGGGGDAILLTDSMTGAQTHALVDAGPAGTNASQPSYVSQRLTALGVDTLAFLLLTHAHGDHFQGMPAVLANQAVTRFIHNNQARVLAEYNNLLTQAAAVVDSMIVPTSTRVLRLGGSPEAALVTVIPPLPNYLANPAADSDSINEGSIGAELRLGTFRMFFTGDGQVQANARWRTQFAALSQDVDILKAGHHGANDAVFDNGFNGASTWLVHTAPAVTLISANGTSHPRINALAHLLQASAGRTYCTNVHGEITVRVTRGGGYTVQVERNADFDCEPGTEATT